MTAPGLAPFLRETHGLDLDGLAEAIRTAVEAGGGTWLCPPPEGSADWPACARVEISLLGVWADGGDTREAVANWLKAARREIAMQMYVAGDAK